MESLRPSEAEIVFWHQVAQKWHFPTWKSLEKLHGVLGHHKDHIYVEKPLSQWGVSKFSDLAVLIG